MSSFQTAQGHAFRKLFCAAGAVTASMRFSVLMGKTLSLLFVAVGLNAGFIVLPHWDNMS